MNSLHAHLKHLPHVDAALVLSTNSFRGLLLNNLAEAIDLLQNKSVPVEGFPEIEVRLVSWPLHTRNSCISLREENESVVVEFNSEFEATIALHCADGPELEFSKIKISVSKLRFSVSASAPNLLIGAPDFDVSGSVVSSDSRDKALEKLDNNEDAVARLEGAMAYVMPRRIAAAVLSTIRSIDLARRFPAFELRGDWALRAKDGYIIVWPSGGIAIRGDLGCPIKDSAPNLSIKASGQQRYPNSDTTIWQIDHNWEPIAKTEEEPRRDVAFAALYAEKPIWDARFGNVMPGIVYQESDNGFIGYDVTFSVGLKKSTLAIDQDRFGMIIDYDLVANGAAFLTIDVPCVGRSDLAYARFRSEPSKLRVLLSVLLLPNGKLVLESEIGSLSIGDIDATVSGFSRWLSLAGGKSAIVGFVLDHLLKRVIEENLPTKIGDAIRQELNSKNFELLDFEGLQSFTEFGRFDGVTYSGDKESVLVGLGSFG